MGYPELFLGVTRTWFKVRCIALIPENVLHTQNVSLSPLETFLQHFEKNHLPKTTVLGGWQIAKLVTVFVKLKTFRLSSIKFFRIVVGPFWSYRKISLSLENIPDVYKVYLGCLEKIFRHVFKNHIFSKKLFFVLQKNRPNSFTIKKSFFEKI